MSARTRMNPGLPLLIRHVVMFSTAGLCACATAASAQSTVAAAGEPRFGMVIHGGAGTITRGSMTAERKAQYRALLEQALQTGYRILAAGGTSLDAVEATVRVMEDSPLFNAGKGAVFTAEGRNELDASIMDGSTLQARWNSLRRELEREGKPMPSRPAGVPREEEAAIDNDQRDHRLGTVGAVALDRRGHLAAATSTGGMTMKRFGRVGDSPVIGAGT